MISLEKQHARQHLLEAFWTLYEKKELEKISIIELCEVARYNRATFYRYFDNIHMILDEAIEDFITFPRSVFSNIQNFQVVFKEDIILRFFLSILKKNELHIQLLIMHHHEYILEEKIKTMIIEILKSKLDIDEKQFIQLRYLLEYQISGIMGILIHWVKQQNELDEKTLINLVLTVSSKGFLTILQSLFPPVNMEEIDHDHAEILQMISQIKDDKY